VEALLDNEKSIISLEVLSKWLHTDIEKFPDTRYGAQGRLWPRLKGIINHSHGCLESTPIMNQRWKNLKVVTEQYNEGNAA
jgi:hypothetical protein